MTKEIKGRAIVAAALKLLANPENHYKRGWSPDGAYLADATCLCLGAALIRGAGFTYTAAEVESVGAVKRIASTLVLFGSPNDLAERNHFARVCNIARAEAAALGHSGVSTLNDSSTHAEVLDFLKTVQKRVNADPWFRRSSVRIAGTERFYQRSRRALRKAQANAEAAA